VQVDRSGTRGDAGSGVAACSAFIRSPLRAACSPTLVSILAPSVAHAGHRGGPVSHVSAAVIVRGEGSRHF
jgi:hypothetical protein